MRADLETNFAAARAVLADLAAAFPDHAPPGGTRETGPLALLRATAAEGPAAPPGWDALLRT
eukprot:3743156-Pyramimonas_sp.AAC.1